MYLICYNSYAPCMPQIINTAYAYKLELSNNANGTESLFLA